MREKGPQALTPCTLSNLGKGREKTSILEILPVEQSQDNSCTWTEKRLRFVTRSNMLFQSVSLRAVLAETLDLKSYIPKRGRTGMMAGQEPKQHRGRQLVFERARCSGFSFKPSSS